MNGKVSALDCIRVIEARSLLESTDLPVDSIAARLGFVSVQEFERLFFRLIRVKPGNIRDGTGKKHKYSHH